jgi:hypothetical protein
MASGSHQFPTYHIPDDGTRFAPGEVVRVDHSSGQVQLITDPAGDYEVMACRQATEYGDGPPCSGSTSAGDDVRLRRMKPPIRGHRGIPTTAEPLHLNPADSAPTARAPRAGHDAQFASVAMSSARPNR